MRRRFTQSLGGYDPQHIDTALQLMSENHQAKLEQMHKELSQLNSQVESLRKSVQLLEEQLGASREQEKHVTNALLGSYLSAIQQLQAARVDLEREEVAAKQRLALKLSQLSELQDYLAQLPREVKAMAKRYLQTVKRVEGKD